MQLAGLDKDNGLRMQKGLQLYDRLRGIDGIRVPFLEKEARNIFSTCPVLVKNKKKVQGILLKKGVNVSLGYLQDCSRLNMFSRFSKDCPNASRIQDEAIYLPLYRELGSSELQFIAEALKEAAKSAIR